MTDAQHAVIRYPKDGRFAQCAKMGGIGMISAWWLIPAAICGGVLGVFLLAILDAGNRGGDGQR